MSLEHRWLRCPRPNPAARLRLICFPHAGGTAGFFRDWPATIDSGIETHIVQYPGREDRLDDPLVDRMEVLADGILEVLPDGPLALFGHSMGAAVAHEVALRLRHDNRNPVAHMAVSGREPPMHQRAGDLHTRGVSAVAAELVRLSPRNAALVGDSALAELILPVVVNDYRLIETYRPGTPPPLDCPLTVLIGDRDTEVSVGEARDWARYTTGRTTVWRLPGDHFYLVDQRATVLDIVERALLGHRDRPGPHQSSTDRNRGAA
ncbi:thioesterase II family protein [Nocardia thraciensis]